MPKKPGEPRKEAKPPGIPYNLKPPPTTPATCLRCDRTFGSVDRARNRVCPRCNTKNSEASRRDASRPAALPRGVLPYDHET